jgi:putative acyl-CoA dehydrogenase
MHHARQRKAFGRLLIDQPLMRNVLADLALECESHIVLVMRLARAFDAQDDESETLLRRVLTPVAKYWVCKRAPVVIAETMEVLGGNGYIEEGPIARRFREAPLNSIWEGSGNIMCLDVLRAFAREPRTREVLSVLLSGSKGRDACYDRFVDALLVELGDVTDGEMRARYLTQKIALAVQAAVLVAHGPESSAQAFLASRLTAGAPAAFGTLSAGVDSGAMIERILRF